MKWEISHRTLYTYASPVRESFNEVRLQPVSNEQQTVDSFLLKVLPTGRLRHYHDFHSNCVHHFEIPEPHSSLSIESRLVVTTRSNGILAPDARPAGMASLPEALHHRRCYDFIQASRYVDLTPDAWRLAVDATQGEDDVWQNAQRLMRFVHGTLTYQSNSTHVHTQMTEALAQRRGVCQDFAHVMIGLCRTLKIPALYVSGYLATQSASATHAWMEVFVPGVGWQGLDPTHNCQPDETYVKIAVGRDYSDVAPVSGTYKGTKDRKLSIEVKIDKRG
ncbi:MAG TPA: transglutaminase family protein [Candidatus Paceibacterota bacterium]|nr:transglutaminase family protein [Candidatus Paceibacterota bacterium]